MVTTEAARLIGRNAEIAIGAEADLVVLDAFDAASAVREVAQPLFGLKRGRLISSGRCRG